MRPPFPLAVLLTLAALPAAAPPAAAQQSAGRADACGRDAARFSETFLDAGRTPAAGGDATTAVPSTGRATAEREIARRGGVVTPPPIGSGIDLAPGDGASAADAPERQPGTRQGARLGDDERRRMRDLVGEARAAAGRGDAEGCLRHLREARALARETGFGSGQPNPGGAAGAQGGSGSSGRSGSAGGAGSLNPTQQQPGATPRTTPQTTPGGPTTPTAPGGMGGGTGGSLGGGAGGGVGGGAGGGGR